MLRSLPHLQNPSSSTHRNLLITIVPLCKNLKHILQIQSFMISTALDQDNIFLSKFIEKCSSLGHSSHALKIFLDRQPRTLSIYVHNTVINALSQSNSPKDSIFCYNSIQESGFRPDSYSVPFVLKAVVRIKAIWVGREVHCQVIGTGLGSDVRVSTSLVQFYASCGCVFDARKVFDEMCGLDNVALWNAMVNGYVKDGDLKNAGVLFEQMRERNVVSWTTLISGYAQRNRASEAIEMFRRMQIEGVKPDEIAMLAALSACADMGALKLGEWIHNYMDKHGLPKTVPFYNALINMYAKSGEIIKSLETFEIMKHRSIVTWTTMIAGFALHGLGREALEMFSRMEKDKFKPNEITFIAILSACSHAGLVEMGRWYFNSMHSRYRIEPQIEHYGCMIDLLGRAGYLQEALELVSKMPFEANGAIWGSLLAGSKIYGDAKLGECALQHLIELEPYNSGNYMLLSNIYASLGRWNEAGIMRKMMKNTGVRKTPGGSFIEVNNKVHEFIAGGISHPQLKSIFEVMFQINEHLKMIGFVHKYCLEDARF